MKTLAEIGTNPVLLLRVIEALKFVRVEVKKGHLTDISIAMLLVELERRGVSFTPALCAPVEKTRDNQ